MEKYDVIRRCSRCGSGQQYVRIKTMERVCKQCSNIEKLPLRHDEDTKKIIAQKHLMEKNPMWKGNNVQRIALHDWIRRRKPKPEFCEDCHKNKPFDLANISGEYRRDINDFKWQCRSCHMKEDGRINNLKQYQANNGI